MPGATGEIAQDIYDETRRLQTVVTNLLDFARIQQASSERRTDFCSVADLMAAAIQLADHRVGPEAISVEFEQCVPGVVVDRVLAEHALANIMRNALRHGAPPITISGVSSAASFSLLVSDSGPGIDPRRVQSDLFRPFRPFGATSRTGLGLWLARELMRSMGGDVQLQSSRPTCFRIEFATRIAVAA